MVQTAQKMHTSFMTFPSVATRGPQHTQPRGRSSRFGQPIPTLPQIPSKDEKRHLERKIEEKRDENRKGGGVCSHLKTTHPSPTSPPWATLSRILNFQTESVSSQLQRGSCLSQTHTHYIQFLKYLWICTGFKNRETASRANFATSSRCQE